MTLHLPSRICQVCGIDFPVTRRARAERKWCSRKCRYANTYRTQSEKLWTYANKEESGCWLWFMGTDKDGYGKYRFEGHDQRSHRIAWKITHGEIPKGMVVCHVRDIPACINPEHLFLGTVKDNNDDKVRKGRQPRGEKIHASILTDVNVAEVISMLGDGWSTRSTASKFNVHETTILNILKGFTWKHIPRVDRKPRMSLIQRHAVIAIAKQHNVPVLYEYPSCMNGLLVISHNRSHCPELFCGTESLGPWNPIDKPHQVELVKNLMQNTKM